MPDSQQVPKSAVHLTAPCSPFQQREPWLPARLPSSPSSPYHPPHLVYSSPGPQAHALCHLQSGTLTALCCPPVTPHCGQVSAHKNLITRNLLEAPWGPGPTVLPGTRSSLPTSSALVPRGSQRVCPEFSPTDSSSVCKPCLEHPSWRVLQGRLRHLPLGPSYLTLQLPPQSTPFPSRCLMFPHSAYQHLTARIFLYLVQCVFSR